MKHFHLAKPANVFGTLAVLSCFLYFCSCTSKIKIGSVKLPESVVKKWLSDSTASQFVFQYSTSNFKADQPLQLVMYVIDINGNCLNPKNPDVLETKAGHEFDEPAILGNNTLTRDEIKNTPIDSSGHAIHYDYILFTPVIDSVYHHIVYDLDFYVHEAKLPTFTKIYQTNPCPPRCHSVTSK